MRAVFTLLFLLVSVNLIGAILPGRKAQRLPNLFSEQVLTPNGYMPKHCVHFVDETDVVGTVGDEFHITHSNGTKKIFPRCAVTTKRSVQQPPQGWAAYAEYTVPAGIASFNGGWNVPGQPTSDVGQTLFLFTGLQNAFNEDQDTTIIQPVLQWGPSEAGGGSYWAIASWYVGSGNAAYSKLARVNSNDAIYGTMTQQSSGDWQINTFDRTSGASVSLTTSVAIKEPYAFVTLEVYSVQTCSNYPPQGIVHFTALQLNTGAASWTPHNVDPGFCKEMVTINSPASVTITF